MNFCAPCVGDGKHEPVRVGAAAKIVVEFAVAHIAWNRVPLYLPAAITVLVQVNAAISTLRAPAEPGMGLSMRQFEP